MVTSQSDFDPSVSLSSGDVAVDSHQDPSVIQVSGADPGIVKGLVTMQSNMPS